MFIGENGDGFFFYFIIITLPTDQRDHKPGSQLKTSLWTHSNSRNSEPLYLYIYCDTMKNIIGMWCVYLYCYASKSKRTNPNNEVTPINCTPCIDSPPPTHPQLHPLNDFSNGSVLQCKGDLESKVERFPALGRHEHRTSSRDHVIHLIKFSHIELFRPNGIHWVKTAGLIQNLYVLG